MKDLDMSIQDRHVLFVEDVIDTGLTLSYLLKEHPSRQPASLEVFCVFNKSKRRLIDLPIKYKGFDLPSSLWWVTGCISRKNTATCPLWGC